MHVRTKVKKSAGRRRKVGRGSGTRKGAGVGNLFKMGTNLLQAPGKILTGIFDPNNWKKMFGFGINKKGGNYAAPYGGRRHRGKRTGSGKAYGGAAYGGAAYGGAAYGGAAYGGRKSGKGFNDKVHKTSCEKHGGALPAIAAAVIPSLLNILMEPDY
jgi:hypothetical protein